MDPIREKIVETARSFIGTKWRHRGRTKRGIDCIGLVVVSLQCAGIKTMDRRNYSRYPWNDGLKQELLNHCGDPVDRKDWKPGDIALMQFDNMPEPSHVGILADHPFGGLSIIHSFSMVNVTEHRIDARWMERIKGVYNPCNG